MDEPGVASSDVKRPVDSGLLHIPANKAGGMNLTRSHRHRDVQGGVARASVFGVSDGLVSNASLILGVAGANVDASFVRLAGIAGLIAGAVSMAAGEYVSMRAQQELFERELELERLEIEHNPETELAELVQLYRNRGLSESTAVEVATQLMSSPEQALEVHAREELGVAPDALGSPVGASVGSFLSFCVGALVPLLAVVLHRRHNGGGGVAAAVDGGCRSRRRGPGQLHGTFDVEVGGSPDADCNGGRSSDLRRGQHGGSADRLVPATVTVTVTVAGARSPPAHTPVTHAGHPQTDGVLSVHK